MDKPEYSVIETGSKANFIEKLKEASENGFIVISSNQFIIMHEGMTGSDTYEIIYYALMVKNSGQPSNDFQYKILDELNEIKFELKDIVKNLKYLGE